MILARTAAIVHLLSGFLAGQPLAPQQIDGQLSVTSSSIDFIAGKSLDRLRNGQTVTFDFHLQLFDGARPLARSFERFVLSYDLWEETFSAVQLSQSSPRTPVYSTSRLKREAVATWCLGRLRLPMPKLDPNQPLTLQLEIRSAGLKLSNPLRPQGTVDLAALVEIFSRPPDPKETRYTAATQSFTLASLGGARP